MAQQAGIPASTLPKSDVADTLVSIVDQGGVKSLVQTPIQRVAEQAGALAATEAQVKIDAIAQDVADARSDMGSAVTAMNASNAQTKTELNATVAGLASQISGAAAGLVQASSWAALTSIAGTRAGQPGRVVGDAGTHTDPVTGATNSPNNGEYSWSTSPAGWRRIGAYDFDLKADKATPITQRGLVKVTGTVGTNPTIEVTAATAAQTIAGTATDMAVTPAGNAATLGKRYGDLRSLNKQFDRRVLNFPDSIGNPGLEGYDDGSLLYAGRRLMFAPPEQAAFDPRQRMMVVMSGGSLALNASNSGYALRETYWPAFQLMMSTGLESLSGSGDAANPATGTVGFNPGITRQRAIGTILRAMAYGPLADSIMIADINARLGSLGQLDGLWTGNPAAANLVSNATVCFNEAATEGETFGIGAMFFQGGDQDWRDSYTIDGYVDAFATRFDKLERSALKFCTFGAMYPRFIQQVCTHTHFSSPYALNVTAAQARLGSIPGNYVAFPDYICDHVDGVLYGSANKFLLTPLGIDHSGLMFGKAWLRWAVTGDWKPCQMLGARRYSPRVIEVSVWTPKPPLQFSTDTVAQVADGNHGLEVWVNSVRQSISSVTIANEGRTNNVARLVINMAADLPAGDVEVWAGRSDDVVGVVNGEVVDGRQPGPKKGPRTTICDSDSVAGEAWAFALNDDAGKPLDARNYLLLGSVVAQ